MIFKITAILVMLAQMAHASNVTTRSIRDWNRHFAFSFGNNKVATIEKDGFTVASLPPMNANSFSVKFPPSDVDCTQDAFANPFFLDDGKALRACKTGVYLFDFNSRSVARLEGAVDTYVFGANGDSIMIKRGNGVYDFFPWTGARSAKTFVRVDLKKRTSERVSLQGRPSVWKANEGFMPPAAELTETAASTYFIVPVSSGSPSVVRIDKNTHAVREIAKLAPSFGSNSEYYSVALDAWRFYVLEFENRDFKFKRRAMLVNIATGKVESLPAVDFLSVMASINGLRFDLASNTISVIGSRFTGCLGTCLSIAPVVYRFDLLSSGNVVELNALHPFSVLYAIYPDFADPALYGSFETYNGYFAEYRWSFNSAGDPVLFRTWGPSNSADYFREVETFFPEQGISKARSSFPNFHYCGLDVQIKPGKILHAGGYINAYHNFKAAYLDQILTLEDTRSSELTVLPERFKTEIKLSGNGRNVEVGPDNSSACNAVTKPSLISSDGETVQLKLNDEILTLKLGSL